MSLPAQLNVSPPPRPGGRRAVALVVRAALVGSVWFAGLAESGPTLLQPPVPIPGGISLQPVITSIAKQGDLTTVGWFGIRGPYQLQRADALGSGWQSLAAPTLGLTQSLSLTGKLGFLRVTSAATQTAASNHWMYLGRDACLECHPSIRHPWYPTTDPPPLNCEFCHGPGFYHAAMPQDYSMRPMNDPSLYLTADTCALCHKDTAAEWRGTLHSTALQTLIATNEQHNPTCLPCHTTGYGTPSGFQTAETTPHLGGVQCENCHGPAGAHVGNTSDVSARPYVTPAAEVCGGCHNAFHHSTYDEWKSSPHATVTPDVASAILAGGEPRMKACGPCHSGAVRLALLDQLENPATPLPGGADTVKFAVTCAVCHDPHQAGANPKQLRNPLYSTNFFSYSTATNTSFAAQYDPSVQACGQCHNMRGAQWDDTSRPPHHSPQYNLLIGQGGYDLGNSSIATHGLKIQQQCVQCHTHTHEADPVSSTNPAYVGHTFEIRFEGCAATNLAVACHAAPTDAAAQLGYTRAGIARLEGEVKSLLDQWATNQAPAVLRAKYGTLAWEYNDPGQLSNPAGDPAFKGPTTAEQASVPEGIKQARFNLYLVEHDASGGAHNARYARRLLTIARDTAKAELSKP